MRGAYFFLLTVLLTTAPHSPQVFRFSNGTEPENLDPQLVTGIPEQTLVQELFEGLVAYSPKDLSPVPGVAERWEIDRTGVRYRFHLRDNAQWSDGSPVTAADFLYSWQRLLEPKTAAPYAYFLYPIRGARDFHQGKVADFSKVAVRAVNPRLLEFDLENPVPYFLSMMCHSSFYPVNRRAIESHGVKWVQPGKLVGNGAFSLTEWKPNARIVLARNANYWDRASVKLDRVEALPIENVDTAYNLYETGVIDFNGFSLPIYRLPQLNQRDDFYNVPYLTMYYYRLNTKRAPFSDKRVRQALNLAIDKETLVRKVTQGGQSPANFMVPPGVAGYEPARGPQYDPQRARQLLAEAGFCVPDAAKAGCKTFPKFSILFNTRDIHKLVAQAIQQMWKLNLGIGEVELINQEWKVYLQSARALDYDVSFGSWIADYADPNAFLEIWQAGNSNNRTGWSSPVYDALIAQAGREMRAPQRFAILRRAEMVLLDEVPAIPIYLFTSLYLMKPYVRGVYPNMMSIHPLKYVWIEK